MEPPAWNYTANRWLCSAAPVRRTLLVVPNQDSSDPYVQLGAVVRRRLTEMDRTQEWLGAEVSTVQGRPNGYKQATVSGWLAGINRPDPDQVFAIERALAMRPGSLSRMLGYVPAGTTEPSGSRQALADDPLLSEVGRRTLLAAYEQLVDHGADGP